MLILGRREGQWVEVTHNATGDTLRIRITNLRDQPARGAPRCDLGFEDPDWHFRIDRPERLPPPAPLRIDEAASRGLAGPSLA